MKRLLCPALFGALALVSCSCSSIKPDDFQPGFLANHVVTVSERGVADVVMDGKYRHDDVRQGRPKKGTYKHSLPEEPKLIFPGPLQQQFEAELERMLDNIEQRAPKRDGKRQILIFAHGGLNTERARLQRIRDLIGVEEDDPDNKIANYYPVFINWESGLFSSYGEHLWTVRGGRKYDTARAASWPLAPLMLLADFGKSVAKTPGVWAAQLTTDVKAAGYRNHDVRSSDRLYEQWKVTTNSLRVERGETNCTSSWYVTRDFATYATTVPVKLLSAPFIDGFGESAWRNMYRRTETMFHSVYEFDIAWGNRGRLTGGTPRALEDRPTGATAQFFEALRRRFGTNGYEITLVAHSAGTIVMNKVLERYPDLPYRKITYMAAACPIAELEGSVIPVMKQQTNVTFLNWCLNPRAEVNESNVLDLAPRGSLLEWIDNFLGNPRTAGERTLGKWENIMQAAHIFPPEIRPRVSIVAAKYQPGCACHSVCEWCDGGQRCDPQKHGDFGRQKFWEDTKREKHRMQAF